jgi:hypothetical protein
MNLYQPIIWADVTDTGPNSGWTIRQPKTFVRRILFARTGPELVEWAKHCGFGFTLNPTHPNAFGGNHAKSRCEFTVERVDCVPLNEVEISYFSKLQWVSEEEARQHMQQSLQP